MGDCTISVEANIRFLTTEQGGRQTALSGNGSYRPNHNFSNPDDPVMCIGFIELDEGERVAPGDSLHKTITFLASSEIAAEIREGREWRIQEGGKLVAIGTVLKVLEGCE